MNIIDFLRKRINTPEAVLYDLRGRSMVEMLGVLVIIGILSVGAIAVYQKAMFKYKLNKQAEQINTFINAVTRYKDSFGFKNHANLVPILTKLGAITPDMIKDQTNYNFYDVFNTQMSISLNIDVKGIWFDLRPDLSKKNNDSLAICLNLYNIIKNNQTDVWQVGTQSKIDDNPSNRSIYYGDNFCNSSVRCLKDLTLTDIQQDCSRHINRNNTIFEVIWKVNG